MVNRVILVGQVESAPELKTFDKFSKVIVRIRITYSIKDGAVSENIIPVSAFNETGQKLNQLRIGDYVSIDGSIKCKATRSKTGETLYFPEISVFQVSKINSESVTTGLASVAEVPVSDDIPF